VGIGRGDWGNSGVLKTANARRAAKEVQLKVMSPPKSFSFSFSYSFSFLFILSLSLSPCPFLTNENEKE
jgi:hypothetical protein